MWRCGTLFDCGVNVAWSSNVEKRATEGKWCEYIMQAKVQTGCFGRSCKTRLKQVQVQMLHGGWVGMESSAQAGADQFQQRAWAGVLCLRVWALSKPPLLSIRHVPSPSCVIQPSLRLREPRPTIRSSGQHSGTRVRVCFKNTRMNT